MRLSSSWHNSPIFVCGKQPAVKNMFNAQTDTETLVRMGNAPLTKDGNIER